MLSMSLPPVRTVRYLAAATALIAGIALVGCSPDDGNGDGDDIGVAVIIKTATNPFYVQVQRGAEEQAAELGVRVTTAAGRDDFDDQTQIDAIENAVARGDQGILIIPTGPGVYNAIQQARDAGVYVIALDAAPDPLDTVDITFATDNFQAGEYIGQWTAAALEGEKAVIAMINYTEDVNDANINRNQGFLNGLGIDLVDDQVLYDEPTTGSYEAGAGGEYEIVCSEIGYGTPDGGRTAAENCLSRSSDINVMYAINEPSASGAYEALRAAGLDEDVLLVTVDGSCSGVNLIQDGVIDANSQQYPYQMSALGVEAIHTLITTGEAPETSAGLDFFNTGVELITDTPMEGVASITSEEAAEICWGEG